MKNLKILNLVLNAFGGRHIKKLELKDFAKINLITGDNGTGKSSLAQALRNLIWQDKENIIPKMKVDAIIGDDSVSCEADENEIEWSMSSISTSKQSHYDFDLGKLIEGDLSSYDELLSNIGKGELNLTPSYKNRVEKSKATKTIKDIANKEAEIKADSTGAYDEYNKNIEEILSLQEELKHFKDILDLCNRYKELKEIEDGEKDIKDLDDKLKTYSPKLAKITDTVKSNFVKMNNKLDNFNDQLIRKAMPKYKGNVPFVKGKDYIDLLIKSDKFIKDFNNKQSEINVQKGLISSVEGNYKDLEINSLLKSFDDKDEFSNDIKNAKLKIDKNEDILNNPKWDKIKALDGDNIKEHSKVLESIKDAGKKEILMESKNTILPLVCGIIFVIILCFGIYSGIKINFDIINILLSVFGLLGAIISFAYCLGKRKFVKSELQKCSNFGDISELWQRNDFDAYHKYNEELNEAKKLKETLDKKLEEVNSKINEIKKHYGFSEDDNKYTCQEKYNDWKTAINNTAKLNKLVAELEDIKKNYNDFLATYGFSAGDLDLDVYAQKIVEDHKLFIEYQKEEDDRVNMENVIKNQEKDISDLYKGLGYVDFVEFTEDINNYDEYKKDKIQLDTLNKKAKPKPIIPDLAGLIGYDRELKIKQEIERIGSIENEIKSIKDKIEEKENKNKELLNKTTDALIKQKEDFVESLTDNFNRNMDIVVEKVLKSHIAIMSRDFAGDIRKKAREYFNKFAFGKYEMDEEDVIKDKEGNEIMSKSEDIDHLSGGTRCQLLLAVKLAVIETQEKDIKYPLILDESFAEIDDESTKAVIEALESLDRQVFYFSPKKEDKAVWENAITDQSNFRYYDLDNL